MTSFDHGGSAAMTLTTYYANLLVPAELDNIVKSVNYACPIYSVEMLDSLDSRPTHITIASSINHVPSSLLLIPEMVTDVWQII